MKHFIPSPVLLVISGIVFLLAACGGDDGMTSPETGQIRITVTLDGVSEGEVTVNLFTSGSSTPTATATTGDDGMATFNDVEPGSYEVEVQPPEGAMLAEGEEARKPVTASAGQTAQVQFELTEADDGIVEVRLTQNLTFSPADLTISPGTTVRWVNDAAIFHTITPDGHSEWTRTTMNQAGETFEHTFDNVGTFAYFCEPHQNQGMTGTITVQ